MPLPHRKYIAVYNMSFRIISASSVRTLLRRITRACVIVRSMADGGGNKATHLDKTESVPREEVIATATIVNLYQLSNTVRGLTLKVQDQLFTFKPGQWVDFFIPGEPTVGGFTICSSPRKLDQEGTIDLAVKHSDHAPANWIHVQCKVGDKVQINVGGGFFYDPQSADASPDLLLIAGGVGINPLYSIIHHAADLYTRTQGRFTSKLLLLFSASTMDELLFRESLIKMSREFPRMFSYKYFVTKEEVAMSDNTTQGHRIDYSSLQEAVSSLDGKTLMSYICGPPPMIRYTSSELKKLGISKDRILYEKWW